MDPILIVVLVGAGVAGFAQGLSGFAFSLVALSFWAWVIGPQLSAPMAVFGALVGQLVALPFVWRGFNMKMFLPLGLAGLAGVPVGAIVLAGLDPHLFRFGLGLLLVLYPPIVLTVSRGVLSYRPFIAGDMAAGWIGGLLGGISGAAGAVPTLWTTIRGWSKDEQRGVLQVFNITMHLATLTTYSVGGVMTPDVIWHIAMITPVVILPALLGVALFRRLDVVTFRKILLALLFVSGVAMIIGSAPGLMLPA